MFELKGLLILLLLIGIEAILLSLFFLSVVQHRIYSYFSSKIMAKKREAISDQIIFLLEHPDSFTPKHVFSNTELLVISLELFNCRIKGEEWRAIKETLISYYLLASARKWTKSWFWKRRSLAARIFALYPLAEDEPRILQLLSDPIFLVQGIAAIAAVKMESKKGIELALQLMSHTATTYTRYYYRDVLLNGSSKAFQYLIEIASEKKNDPAIQLAALEVFSGKTVPFPIPFLQEALSSSDPRILATALKVLARNPLKNIEEIFLKACTHPAEKVRVAAAMGLTPFYQPNVLQSLANMLKDPSWEVRLQAATSLSQMGVEGTNLLKQQDPKTNPIAAEVARYALDFLV